MEHHREFGESQDPRRTTARLVNKDIGIFHALFGLGTCFDMVHSLG